jgi:hypothetical protein
MFHPQRERVPFQTFVPWFFWQERSETLSWTQRTVMSSWFTMTIQM